MAFFESEIVQEEAKRLFTDYQELMQLGSDYGKFDREGKKKFIDTMEGLMQRYRVGPVHSHWFFLAGKSLLRVLLVPEDLLGPALKF